MCTSGAVVLGPEMFGRGAGGPLVQERTFELPGAGSVCVQVLNGDESQSQRVTSGSIRVDGVEVLGASAFNPGAEAARARLVLEAGTHTLSVSVAGKPTSFLSLSVRFASATSPSPNEMFALLGLHAEPASFTPDGNGVFDETELRGVADVSSSIPGNSGAHSFEIAVTFEIASAADCLPVRTLPVSSAITPGVPLVVAARWDGTDGDGGRVPDGRYFFRASGRVARTGQNSAVATAASPVAALDVGTDADGTEPPDTGLVVSVRTGPFAATDPAPAPTIDNHAAAREALEAMRPFIDTALEGQLLGVTYEARSFPVAGTTRSVDVPVANARFSILTGWRNVAVVADPVQVWVPMTANAPLLIVGSRYAVFARHHPTLGDLRDVGAEASFLLFTGSSTVKVLGEQFGIAEVRALTGTE